MKKVILAALILLCFPSLSQSQIVFPLTLKVQWDASPASENVEFYIVIVDGAMVNVPIGSCTPTVCTQSFPITNAGPHTVVVTAANLFGSSVPATVTFTAVVPGKSGNVKITK